MDIRKENVFELHSIPVKLVNKNVIAMMGFEEKIEGVFMSVRDQVVFTNKRLISVEVHGVTGLQQDIFSLPYRQIQYWKIKTSGFGEFIPTTQLELFFSDGGKGIFNFQEKVNILNIARIISENSI